MTISERITQYLEVGGLFNPELMEPDKVRDLLRDCRTEMQRLTIDHGEVLAQVASSIDAACANSDKTIAELSNALRFYSNQDNYNDDPSDIPGMAVPGTSPIMVDHGDRAAIALTQAPTGKAKE